MQNKSYESTMYSWHEYQLAVVYHFFNTLWFWTLFANVLFRVFASIFISAIGPIIFLWDQCYTCFMKIIWKFSFTVNAYLIRTIWPLKVQENCCMKSSELGPFMRSSFLITFFYFNYGNWFV